MSVPLALVRTITRIVCMVDAVETVIEEGIVDRQSAAQAHIMAVVEVRLVFDKAV